MHRTLITVVAASWVTGRLQSEVASEWTTRGLRTRWPLQQVTCGSGDAKGPFDDLRIKLCIIKRVEVSGKREESTKNEQSTRMNNGKTGVAASCLDDGENVRDPTSAGLGVVDTESGTAEDELYVATGSRHFDVLATVDAVVDHERGVLGLRRRSADLGLDLVGLAGQNLKRSVELSL